MQLQVIVAAGPQQLPCGHGVDHGGLLVEVRDDDGELVAICCRACARPFELAALDTEVVPTWRRRPRAAS